MQLPGHGLLQHVALAAVLLIVSLATGRTPAGSAAAQSGSRISWHGRTWYQHGANVPWFNWGCDFGCAGDGGVSSNDVNAALADRFNRAKASGIHTIRWWMFEGDAQAIGRDAHGAPATIDPGVYTDIDAALRLADTYDLYYDFVLFSAPTHLPAAWITDATQRTQLVAALTPLFARYKGNPRLMSWEVFNEPEWDVWTNKIDEAPLQDTVRSIAGAVHASSDAYVTVGSAMLDGLPMWVGQGLDYYQAHWYDFMSSGEWCAICVTYADVQARYHLDAPLVIGELYAGTDASPVDRLNTFYNAGYAGAWPWSLFPDHTEDRISIDLAAAQTFAGQHPDTRP